MITGKTLIEMGYKQGKWFKAAIEHANAHHLEGDSLRAYLDTFYIEPIEPFDKPLTYHRNIRAESEDELSNVQSVFATMNELMKTPTLVAGAVMPDACPTGGTGQIPVGGVVAARPRAR